MSVAPQKVSRAAQPGSADGNTNLQVPVTVVSSVEEFQSIFHRPSSSPQTTRSDAFLLCYELPADGVTSDALMRFQQAVQDAVRRHGTRLRLYLWDCTSAAFAPAKAQLDKQPGHPLLLIIFQGAVADTVRHTSLADMTASDVERICGRLASFQTSAKPARVVDGPQRPVASDAEAAHRASPPSASPAVPQSHQEPAQQQQHLSVDVAKMVGMGKKLMAERKPFYAEKFFVKALSSLDAVAADVDRLVAAREDYDGSVALCLAWAGMAQLVQGTHIVDNPYLRRLRQSEQLREFREEPMSETCRALVTWDLMQAAPRTWSETECSEKKLREQLQAHPQDTASRSLLVVTLFLSGDVERALTEALKLHVCGEAFGRVALKQISIFLGKDHALVQRLGVPALLESALSN